jgi:DNA repair protein RadD
VAALIALREYQDVSVRALRAAYAAGKRAPLLALPTGGGKTVIFSYVTHGAQARGKRVLIVAHRRELIRQASNKLSDVGVQHGIIAPGFTPTRDTVQVASVQTLGNRLDRIGEFDLIVIDEAHHSVAGSWSRLIASQPRAKLLGVTATPERGDGRGLGITAGGVFDTLVTGPSVRWLTDNGYLAPARVFAPAHAPDLSGVAIRMGDYDRGGLSDAMNKPTITGDAEAHYRKHLNGAPAIVFCVDVQHAKDVAAAFAKMGWRATAADGSMKAPERDAAIGGLATGAVQVLCTCDLISEGLDVPAVSGVILLRSTKSLGLFLQQVGRGLRMAPGKSHLVVLDHAGCTLRHGMPDEERTWSLEGRPKKEQAPPTRQCPTCFAIFSPASVCPECGHSFESEIKAARELEVIAGELEEINAARLDALRRTPLAQLLTGRETLSELMEIQKTKGYKQGWAFHVIRERRERRGAAA